MEAGKKERNLLGKVLSAEDTMKVKSNLWLLKRDVGKGKLSVVQELSTVQQGSDPSAEAVLGLSLPWVYQWEKLPLEMHFAVNVEDYPY